MKRLIALAIAGVMVVAAPAAARDRLTVHRATGAILSYSHSHLYGLGDFLIYNCQRQSQTRVRCVISGLVQPPDPGAQAEITWTDGWETGAQEIQPGDTVEYSAVARLSRGRVKVILVY